MGILIALNKQEEKEKVYQEKKTHLTKKKFTCAEEGEGNSGPKFSSKGGSGSNGARRGKRQKKNLRQGGECRPEG